MRPPCATLALIAACLLGCADPTAIEVSVYSDVPCSAHAEVALSVAGDPQSLATAAPAAVATQCDEVGNGTVLRGYVVLLPQGDREKHVAFQVATRNDSQPLDACAMDPKACIAARRQLRFQSNKTVDVRVHLRLACLGVVCPLDQTCALGTCVTSELPSCDPSCGEPDAPSLTAVPVPVTVVVTTVAGSGSQAYADGTGVAASFNGPYGIARGGAGDLYIADAFNNRVRIVSPAGVVTTLAGSGTAAYADGVGTMASFSQPIGIALDGAGNAYVGDASNARIRMVDSSGLVTTVAGTGSQGFVNGTGTGASFGLPAGVTFDGMSNLYVADHDNNAIRKVTSAGVVTTLAGSGSQGSADGTGGAASFYHPSGLAADAVGNVYVADTLNNRIRVVTSAGVVTTFAGSGAQGSADGKGGAASFWTPFSMALDGAGNVVVADLNNNRIRRVTSTGVVSTLAGGSQGYADGTDSSAMFFWPSGLAVDTTGHVYVADYGNCRIRELTTTGIGELALSWSPGADGGSPITGYTASAAATAQLTRTCSAGATTCIITGLTSGVAYSVSVTATNALGTSSPSATVSATPN